MQKRWFSTGGPDEGMKSLAHGLVFGLAAIGPGVGIGLVFASAIEATARHPRCRSDPHDDVLGSRDRGARLIGFVSRSSLVGKERQMKTFSSSWLRRAPSTRRNERHRPDPSGHGRLVWESSASRSSRPSMWKVFPKLRDTIEAARRPSRTPSRVRRAPRPRRRATRRVQEAARRGALGAIASSKRRVNRPSSPQGPLAKAERSPRDRGPRVEQIEAERTARSRSCRARFGHHDRARRAGRGSLTRRHAQRDMVDAYIKEERHGRQGSRTNVASSESSSPATRSPLQRRPCRGELDRVEASCFALPRSSIRTTS